MSGKTAGLPVGPRLRAAAEYAAARFVPGEEEKRICADIGCDHGYLSIYLVENGLCDFVYACDINDKPLSVARENIAGRPEKNGVLASRRIAVEKHDGLAGLSGKGINRVVICGMGGEVIAGILEKSPEFHTEEVPYVLQPMSRETELRIWLMGNGFVIRDETLVRDAGRVYTVMLAGKGREELPYSMSELYLGRENIRKGGEYLPELLERKLLHARNLVSADMLSHRRVPENAALFCELCDLRRSFGKALSESDRELYEDLSEAAKSTKSEY